MTTDFCGGALPDEIGLEELLVRCVLAVAGLGIALFVVAATLSGLWKAVSRTWVRVKWSGPYRVGLACHGDGSARKLVAPVGYADGRQRLRAGTSSRQPVEPMDYDSGRGAEFRFGIWSGVWSAIVMIVVVAWWSR